MIGAPLQRNPFRLTPLPFTLCPLPSALCPLPFALCPLPFALCPLPFALCPLPFALCPLPFALCPLPFALCPLPFALCPLRFSLCHETWVSLPRCIVDGCESLMRIESKRTRTSFCVMFGAESFRFFSPTTSATQGIDGESTSRRSHKLLDSRWYLPM